MQEALSLIPALVKVTGKRSLHFKLNVFNQHVNKFFLSLLQQNDLSPNLKLHHLHLVQPECTELQACTPVSKSIQACSSTCTGEHGTAVLYRSHHGPLSLFRCVNVFSYTNPTATIACHIQHSNTLYSWTAHTQVVPHTAGSITT